jgi:hypothetical protein
VLPGDLQCRPEAGMNIPTNRQTLRLQEVPVGQAGAADPHEIRPRWHNAQNQQHARPQCVSWWFRETIAIMPIGVTGSCVTRESLLDQDREVLVDEPYRMPLATCTLMNYVLSDVQARRVC